MLGEAEFSYEDRYGIRPASRWRGVALIIAVLGIVWVFWAGLHHANPEVRATLISFQVRDDRSIAIRYEISRRSADSEITCTLVARDFDKNIVGQIDDLITKGEKNLSREVVIPTRAKPVNAAVLNCRSN